MNYNILEGSMFHRTACWKKEHSYKWGPRGLIKGGMRGGLKNPPPTLKVAIIFRLPEISVKPGPFEYVLGLPNSHEVDWTQQ